MSWEKERKKERKRKKKKREREKAKFYCLDDCTNIISMLNFVV